MESSDSDSDLNCNEQLCVAISEKRENKQPMNRRRPLTESTSLEHGRPSTSRESILPEKSGLVAKEKPSHDEKYHRGAKRPRLILNNTLQPEQDNDVTVDPGSRGNNVTVIPHLQGSTTGIIQTPSFDPEKTYAASGLKRSLHGVVYQWKHLMLILHRTWKMGHSFRLATEMDAAEKFDDVVLEYEVSPGNKVHRFVQLKHKQGKTDCRVIGANDLLDVADGEFSMLKYFISWLKIRKHSDFGESRSKKFILCTNIGLDVVGLKKKNIDVNEVAETDGFLNVTVETNRAPRFYKLLNQPSELCDTLKFASDVHVLARELAQRVCSSKDILLNTDILKSFHIALAREVIDITNQNFINNFVENLDLSSKAKNFRKIFLLHAKTFFPRNTSDEDIWTSLRENKLKLSTTFGKKFEPSINPQITRVVLFTVEFVNLLKNASDDNVVKIDRRIYSKRAMDLSKRLVADNVDKLAGHVLIMENEKIKFRSKFLKGDLQLPGNIEEFKDALNTFLGSKFNELDVLEFQINKFVTCTEEELTSRTELPDDQIDEREISCFFDEFILAVDQPNEVELGEMIKREIGSYSQLNLLNVDFIGDSFQDVILDWFKKTGNQSKFLGNEDAEAFFLAIERELSSLITVGLNLPYSAELKKYDIKFESENKDLQNFLSASDSTQQPIFELISSEPTLLTALRVYQTLGHIEKYKTNDSSIFIRLEQLLLPDITSQVLRAFQSPRSHNLLIIDCESIDANQNLLTLWNQLSEIMERCSRKKMILIIRGTSDSAVRFQIGYQSFNEKSDVISIDNLNEFSRQKLVEEKVVKFQGSNESTSFGRLLNLDNVGSEKWKDLGRIIDSNTLVQLIQGDEIEIDSEVKGLCEVENYYIPRTVVQHVVIRAAILQEQGISDLFAIGGISQEALRKLVATEKGSHSFDACSQTDSYMNKYFILGNGREKRDFETICEQNSNRNIHWLQGETRKLVWVESYGTVTNLIAFEDANGNFDNNDIPGMISLTEDELAKHDEKRKIVILSDTAGMGKSTVLTHLAEKMKQNESSLLVIRVDLTRHTTVLDEEKKKRTFNGCHTKAAVDFLVNKLLNFGGGMKRELFKTMIMETGEATLLLDGFDEISPNYENEVIELLQAFAKLHIKKLIVTTRPHTSKVLENKMGMFSYRLQPFSKANQVEFLAKFWRNGFSSNHSIETTEEHLKEHARAVLEILANSVNPQMKEFTGVPLQTRLVAEIFPYEKNATLRGFVSSDEVLNSEGDAPKLPKVINIIDLYKYFVDKKYRIFCNEKKFGDQTNLAEMKDAKVTHQMFLIAHQKLALDALFGEETVKALLSCQPEIDMIYTLFRDKNDGEERTGIVSQVIDSKPHFIHRTFAEYFAATFLINTLRDDRRNQQVREFFVARLFVQPEYKTIRAFLNHLLSDQDVRFQKESWEFILNDNRNAKRQTLYHVAAYEINVEIVRFFLNRLVANNEDRNPENITEISLKSKTGINLHDESTETALTISAGVACNLNLVVCFVEGGADINYQWQDSNTPLHCAVRKVGNLNVVKYLVEKGACINFRDKYRDTPLHIAASVNGNLDIVQYLVEQGGSAVSENKYSGTPLHSAAFGADNLDIVKYLVEQGASINSLDEYHDTPLHFAAATADNLSVVEYLVEKGASIDSKEKDGSTPLHHATSMAGNLGVVEYLVEKGASIDFEMENGGTPLHCAASSAGSLDVVKYLVEKGASIVSQKKDGRTPLHCAALTACNLDIVAYLVEKGSSIDFEEKDGKTPLHCAASTVGNLDVVKYLVEKGANIDSEEKDGQTTLHCAASKAGNLDTVKYLVEKGANIVSRTKDSDTPLHCAARTADNLDVVKYLVENSFTIISQTKSGYTPLHCAADISGNLNVVKYLVEKGADVTCRTKFGDTPLHYAARQADNSDVVQYLVEKGANIMSQTERGWTPLHYAVCLANDSDTVKYLVEKGANIDIKDIDGHTLIQCALAEASDRNIVNYLLEKNILINTDDKDHRAHLDQTENK